MYKSLDHGFLTLSCDQCYKLNVLNPLEGAMMLPLIEQEFSIVVVAQSHNPTILNPDFLKLNEIVPKDWVLAEPPVCIPPGFAQVMFANGVSITAQLDKIIFLESLKTNCTGIGIHTIAKNYIKTLPHVDYRAIGINPKGHILLKENQIQEYLADTFLAPGSWRKIGKAPMKAQLKLTYTLDKCLCTITISEGIMQPSPEITQRSVLLIEGNFHHEINGNTKDIKLEKACQVIDDRENFFKMYREMVRQIMDNKEVA